MSNSLDQKEALIDELLVARSKAHKAYVVLRFQGRKGDAAKIKNKVDQLSDSIEGLLSELMSEWCASAEEKMLSVKRANRDLQRAIRQIQNGVAVPRRVAKVLSVLDEVIGWASELVV
ncbi:MAG: hypothetical protein GXP48_07775 [Acidobacteria bacterium]|nr:hypothetical protein [Acidobacteriota bacterium]